MNWKFWRWQWWRPPPDTPIPAAEGRPPVDHPEVEAAVRRAHNAGRDTDHLLLELRDLAERARRQREENHFGVDLYKVMKDRRRGG